MNGRAHVLVLILGLSFGLPHAVRAQPSVNEAQLVRADELFEQGKARMAQGDFAGACQALAESYALDPATGCLLALALCREKEGKLVSAQRAYAEVIVRAGAAGQREREAAARAKLAELLPQISTLTLRAPTDTPASSLRVRINGELLSAQQLDVALPMDGGVLNLEVEKDGREAWRSAVTLAARGESKRVDIPSLRPQRALAPKAEPRPAQAAAARARPVADAPARSSGQRLGLGLLATGGAGIATGMFFSVRKSVRAREADLECKDVCTEQGLAARSDADAARKLSILSYSIGGSLAAAGLLVHFYARPKTSTRAVALAPWAQSRAAGLSVSGHY